MGRMHSGGKGISKSALPYRRSVPSVSFLIALINQLAYWCRQIVAEIVIWRSQGTHLQAFPQGFDPFPNRCHPPWFIWCCPSPFRHRKQNPSHPPRQGSCPRSSRRFVPLDQEGCRCPQASWTQSQGSWCQVQAHFGRKPYPPFGPLLQDQDGPPPNLEIFFPDRLCSCRLKRCPSLSVDDVSKEILIIPEFCEEDERKNKGKNRAYFIFVCFFYLHFHNSSLFFMYRCLCHLYSLSKRPLIENCGWILLKMQIHRCE